MTYTGSKAQAARGGVVSIGATPTEIGEVKSFSLNRGEWQTVETTNFDSAADEEVLTTIRSNGTVSFKINRVSSDAGQVLLEAAYQSGALTAFVWQLPKTTTQTTAGDKYTFSAFVIKSNVSGDPKAIVDGDIELKISGTTPLVVGS